MCRSILNYFILQSRRSGWNGRVAVELIVAPPDQGGVITSQTTLSGRTTYIPRLAPTLIMASPKPQWKRSLPADLIAGVTTALVGIPQVMGFALVAGINPLYGLYTAAFATAIGALVTGSTYLKVMLSNVLAVSIYFILALSRRPTSRPPFLS